MESGKILFSRENPRNFVSFNNGVPGSKTMPNELTQKPMPPILDRFRALLKQRDDELRVPADDDVAPPCTEEIVQLYEIVLAELTFNSKPIITDLTIIAGEQQEHGEGIADAICARIVEAPVDQKLPSLYLLDSIVKNIGREYVSYFSSRLPEVFCEAYRQIHPSFYPAMRHLFGTWSTVFPASVLCKIETELQFSSSVNQQSSAATSLRSSESPRPSHGIHVNPKYLRQLEHQSTAENDMPLQNIQQVRGTASGLKICERNHGMEFGDFDSDHMDVTTSVGVQRLKSTGNIGRASFAIGKLQQPMVSRAETTLSPLVSEVDESAVDGSPGRLLEGASPSHPDFDYKHGRATGRDGDMKDLQRRHYSEDDHNHLEVSNTYNMSNGCKHQTQRALIDAYGIDRGKVGSDYKPPQVERLDVNGLGTKLASKSWQNTEEEEFDWEDMSPTLSDRGRSNDFLTSSIPPIGTGVLRLGGLPLVGGEKLATLVEKHPEAKPMLIRPHMVVSRAASSRIESASSSPGLWPPLNVNKPVPLPMPSTHTLRRQTRGQFDSVNTGNTINQALNKTPYILEQRFNNFDNKEPTLTRLLQTQNQHLLHQRNPLQAPPPQFLPSHGVQEKFPFSNAASTQSRLPMPPLSHGFVPHGHRMIMGMVPPNPVPVGQPPIAHQSVAPMSLSLEGVAPLPTLPSGLRAAPQMTSSLNAGSVSNQSQNTPFSGLINSLMAQGMISLTTPVQDYVGLDFNLDALKIRHESALNALYSDLPRQCSTCGLRFKCQEDHSSHMDWHVTRNRMSKNRKQKPSRKWFVSSSMWLCGAEALGTDSVPGFLSNEAFVDQKDDEEMAVPADEDQNVCALCGEPFDEFYSDETEGWMYKGAVYMNVPSGLTAGLDRSDLGPIVHDKCRSESSVVPSEDYGSVEGGTAEDGRERKRMRG